MKKTVLFFIIVFLLSAIDASGTAQIPDKLVYNGKTYSIFSNPFGAQKAERLGGKD